MINSPPARRTLGTAGTGARGQEDQGGDSCAALIASVDSFVDGLKDGNRPRAGPSREVTINAVSRSGAGRARDDEVTQARSVVTQGAAPSMKKRAPGVAVVIPKVNLPKPMPLSTRASTRHPSMKLHTKDVNRPSKTGNTAPAPVKPMPSFRLVIPKSNTKRSPSPRAVHTAASGKLAEPLESLSSPSRSDAGTVIPVLESPENLLEAFESDLPVPLHPHVEEPSVVFGNQVETAAPIDYLELPSGDSSDEEEPELQDPLPSLPSSQELPAPVRLDVSPGLPALDATVAPSPASPRSQTAAQSDPTAFCLDVGGDEDDQIEEDLQGDDPFGFAKAERQLQKWRRQGVIQAPELEVSGGADETGNDRDEAGSLSYDQLDELLDSQSPFQPFDDDELSTAVDATALSVPQRQSTPTTKRPTPREPESSPLSALSDYDEPMDVSGLRSSAKRKLASGAHEETDDEQAKGKRPSRRPARKDKGRAKKGHSQYVSRFTPQYAEMLTKLAGGHKLCRRRRGAKDR